MDYLLDWYIYNIFLAELKVDICANSRCFQKEWVWLSLLHTADLNANQMTEFKNHTVVSPTGAGSQGCTLENSQEASRKVGWWEIDSICGFLLMPTHLERSPSGTDAKRSVSRPSAEVPKRSLGNTYSFSSCNILSCLPFPFLPPVMDVTSSEIWLLPGTEMSFSSHNLHNWSSWAVTHHFWLSTSSDGEVATDATKSPIPCRVSLRRGVSFKKYSLLSKLIYFPLWQYARFFH